MPEEMEKRGVVDSEQEKAAAEKVRKRNEKLDKKSKEVLDGRKG